MAEPPKRRSLRRFLRGMQVAAHAAAIYAIFPSSIVALIALASYYNTRAPATPLSCPIENSEMNESSVMKC